jgi:hypothetical protein
MALRTVWSETCEQRDRCYKQVFVLDKLPTRLEPTA